MNRADQIRMKDDVQMMDYLCDIHPKCETCPFFDGMRCTVTEYVIEEVEE